MTDTCQLAHWLAESSAAVAFTGAGISTESGIPDFRSPGGVWSRRRTVMFHEFLQSADARFEYWYQKSEAQQQFAVAQPNIAHRALADWEQAGRLRGVITQNIDGLHQLAGSRHVLELHGTAREIACLQCGDRTEAGVLVERFVAEQVVPDCYVCGGLLKHATVSFGQSLPEEVIARAVDWSESCDLFLVLGSSLVVHPAAGLPQLARQSGARLVIINRDPTPLDTLASLLIHDPIGQTIESVLAELGNHEPSNQKTATGRSRTDSDFGNAS